MLVEVHMLQNHAPSNLNRDDTGSPKEAIFGGHKRARISSQCLKRSIRRSAIFQETLAGHLGTRTRSLPELIRARLLDVGVSEDMAEIAARKASGFGTENGKEKEPDKSGHYRTAQTMFLSAADIASVADVLRKAVEEAKNAKELEKIPAKDLQKAAEDKGFRVMPVDIALFGRMVTSPAFLDVDASCQFAHAISTHKVDHEFDYFTAIDDLERAADDEAGAGADMIGDLEFNSACYYKYLNVHVDGLIDNLTGAATGRQVTQEDEEAAREIAATAIRTMIRTACLVTPTGKQNTFAAHQPPSLTWIEIRDSNLPVSYANAFCQPVDPRGRDGLETASADALKNECETLTEMYDLTARSRLLLAKTREIEILGVKSAMSLNQLLDQVEEEVRRG